MAGYVMDLFDTAWSDDAVLGTGVQTSAEQVAVEPPFADLQAQCGLYVNFDLKGPEDGPKLLYIPGVTDDLRKTLSRSHFNAFTNEFRTLTCDLRNQGETRPFTVDRYVPLETYVHDLIALVDAAFSPQTVFHVVGWSSGGVLALLMARLHPARVRSVAVLAGGYWDPQESYAGSSFPADAELFGNDRNWIQTYSSYAKLPTLERCEQTLVHADLRRADRTFRERMVPSFQWYLDNFVRSEELTVMSSAEELGAGVLAQLTALFAEGTPHVEDITVPTIIVHGRHDGIHRVERALDLKNRMSSAFLVILEDEGHVLVTAALHTVKSFLRPQAGVHPSVRHMPMRSMVRAMAAFARIFAAYNRAGFQKKLRTIFTEPDATIAEKEQKLENLCLQVQYCILEEYGISVVSSASEEGRGNQECASVDWLIRRLAALGNAALVDGRMAVPQKLEAAPWKFNSATQLRSCTCIDTFTKRIAI